MSFEELYDSCFRNIQLLKVAHQKEADSNVTLDSLFSSSHYVAFLLTAGVRGLDVARRLNHMAQKLNERDKEKPQQSPARLRRLFTLKKKKKKDALDISTVSVVIMDIDHSPIPDAARSISQPGCFIYAPQGPTMKSRFLRALGLEFPPSIIIVDVASKSVITTEGRRLLAEDPLGNSFPWWPPSSSDVLKGTLVKKVDGKIESCDMNTVKANVKGLLFGAYWCPPCRQWVKQLGPVYEAFKERGLSLEIIFCSSDRSQEMFEQFLEQMPWFAFSYDTAKTIALTRLYNISGIPALILIDEAGRVISRHGRALLLGDSDGSQFPWGPRPMYELNEFSVCRLRDEPSLVLFTEGSPEDVQFSVSVLDTLAKRLFNERNQIEAKRLEERERRMEERENVENGNPLSKSASSEECSSASSADLTVPPQADPLQILFTGEDPICDHILDKILGLPDAELPLICIVDGLAGQMAVCNQPDVSETILDEFVNAYRNGQLEWKPLPSANDNNRTVGGIPASMIEQVLATSPSQNSVSDLQ